MRVLIVDAFSGSQAGRAAFRKFDELVRSAFRLVERQEHGRTEFLVRHFTKGLEELCYDKESVELTSKGAVAAVDKLDFVFVDGDSRLLPWHARTRKLVVFIRTVLGAKKCLFAAGPGAHIVAYVCATGGKMLRVLNGGENGGRLLELSSRRPESFGGSGKPRCAGEAQEVALDAATGDFYAFDSETDQWVAEGNVGIHNSRAEGGGVAAAVFADSAGVLNGYGGAKKIPAHDARGMRCNGQVAAEINTKALDRTNAPRFQSEVLVRIRPNSRTHTLLRRAVHCGEFLAWSPGRWGVGEATAAFCRRSFAVLASSQRAGPEIIEVGNCLATRFNIRREYKHSVRILQAFIDNKHTLTREKNRLDRGSEFVISGSLGDDVGDTAFGTCDQRGSRGRAASSSYGQDHLTRHALGATSRRYRSRNNDVAAAKKTASTRDAPFPCRPEPAEKPRFAPPHCSRTIRVAAPISETSKVPPHLSRTVPIAAPICETSQEKIKPGGGTQRCENAGKQSGGREGQTATDPAGRRRVLMARIGERVGLNLSPAIDALLCDEENRRAQRRHEEEEDDEQPNTSRSAPAAYELGVRSFGTTRGGQGQDTEQALCSLRTEQYSEEGGEEEPEGGRLEGNRSSSHDVNLAPNTRARRGCPVVGSGGARRQETESPVVRFPGHDQKKPYNSYHRFEKMAEGTRGLFFSVACDTGDVCLDPRKDVSTAPPPAVPKHQKKKRAGNGNGNGDGSDGGKRPFCATFGIKEAWPTVQKGGVRTQGPYVGKSPEMFPAREKTDLFMSSKGWTKSGAKTRAWSGIGEGIAHAKTGY